VGSEHVEPENDISRIDKLKIEHTPVTKCPRSTADEIDKICSSKEHGNYSGGDASADGVQRDLLPIIEVVRKPQSFSPRISYRVSPSGTSCRQGCTVNTKFGNVVTDHILFIASGAFHSVKPSDLLAELQGRLPIRVTLKGLTEDDMYRILTEPVTNLIRQQVELLKTEGVELSFDEAALREIARTAVAANTLVENLGARRLHAVLETIMEDISFAASTQPAGQRVLVTESLVKERLKAYVVNKDMARSIL
jgi:ATP-dependent HslUV protease ATP-binding subunit HslU